jgi:hypothetical protein
VLKIAVRLNIRLRATLSYAARVSGEPQCIPIWGLALACTARVGICKFWIASRGRMIAITTLVRFEVALQLRLRAENIGWCIVARVESTVSDCHS